MQKSPIAIACTLLAFALPVFAKTPDIGFSTYKFDYQVPQKLQQICTQKLARWDYHQNTAGNCMVVDIELIKSYHAWIDDIINHNFSSPTGQEKMRIMYNEQADDVYNTLQSFDPILPTQFEDSRRIKLIGTSPRLTQILALNYNYLGGNHGMPSRTFYVFDMQTKKQLTLDDILVSPTKKAQLEKLAFAKFKAFIQAYYQEHKIAFDKQVFDEYQQVWGFELTDNFYFSQKGLTFSYDPYILGPYAMGFISLTLDSSSLKDIIKGDYLNQPFGKLDDSDWYIN